MQGPKDVAPPIAFRYVVPAAASSTPALEGSTAYQPKPGWTAQRLMVAAANPLATDAGFQVLQAGGSAVDAAVAVQMVLTLVEPQSSGIGGGAFLLHADASNKLVAWDGRETAPAAADANLFMQSDGNPMPFAQAVVGGRAVGVPGAVRMLEAAHREHGQLPWAALFVPAITLAREGFAVSHRLHTQLKADPTLKADPVARVYFYGADGEPHAIGHKLTNPALATVLERIAREGADALHGGKVAEDIVARVRSHPSNPGRLALTDMETYRPKKREALCTAWREQLRVCGFPPPSSGHLTIMQMLGVLDAHAGARLASAQALVAPLAPANMSDAASSDAAARAQASPPPWARTATLSADWLHHYTEAARLAFADRALYVADPDFVAAPAGRWTSLLDKTYLQERASSIGDRSIGTAQPGVPKGANAVALGTMPDQPETGTSHVSIVDAHGRVVAMTTTIEAIFGARMMSDGGTGLRGGFLLNNELTDFSFTPTDAQGRAIANRVEPGKRPRSSMSPTLVFESPSPSSSSPRADDAASSTMVPSDARLVMSVGSPGGAAIIHYTAKTLLGVFAWGLDAQRAIDLPNAATFNGPTLLEKDRHAATVSQALTARGHAVQVNDLVSGLQAIQRTATGWHGGADPRREGVVMGR